jgi:Domain of unknown function (DUF222)
MAVMVGWEHGYGDDEDILAADPADVPPCPDPEDLLDPTEELPPALLLAADPTQLPGQWVDHGLSSWFAHTNRAALAQARWMLEASRSSASTRERVLDRPRPGKIVAASLGWSESYASGRLEFARQILERLPALGDAMADGRLEEHKAWIFTTTLAELDTTQARTVVERVLPDAPRISFGVLRVRIEKAAEDIDPGWAAARRNAAIARRRVTFRTAPSGATDLCGLDLPEEPAQDAHDRIVALARLIARRLRAAGLDAPTGPIQSEVMLTLTGPAGAGMWDQDVIDHVVDRFGGPTDSDDPDDGPDDDGPDDNGPDEGPADGPADGPDDDRLTDGPDGGAPDDRGPDDRPHAEAEPDGDRGGPEGEPDLDVGPAGDATHGPTAGAGDTKPPWRVPFVPRVALRVGLRTVLGLDRRAGELPGRGAVTNSVAVSMAWNRAHSTMRLLLYTPDGHLEHVLTVHPPRRGEPPPHTHQRRHHIVELTAYTHELDTLTAALAGEQLALHGDPPPDGVLIHGDALGLLERATRALAAARARRREEHPAHTTAESGNRFASAALRAWVQARDQTCRGPGCSADAVTCDIDHTLPVTEGGLTRADDLGPFCRRDHTFKHDPDTGWTVQQTNPGRFAWTAPTGRVHIREPEPYDPLPDPIPRTDDNHSEPPGLTLDPVPAATHPPGSPRRNKHGYLTRAAIDTAARLRQRARHQPETEAVAGQNPEDRFPEEPPF